MTHEWEFSHVKSTGYFLKVKEGIQTIRGHFDPPMDQNAPEIFQNKDCDPTEIGLDRFWALFGPFLFLIKILS